MLYNKNNVRKTNDKKILHKVGKQWKVVSVALLMAIGGGAAVAATNNANANADANNGVTQETQATVNSLEQGPQIGQSSAPASASSKASSASSAAPVMPKLSLNPDPSLNGNNASAELARVTQGYDNAVVKFYGNKVQSYVNFVNSNYSASANSVNSNYASASNKQSSDVSSANSFSAVAAGKDWSAEVNNIASAKSGVTGSEFIDAVQNSTKSNSTDVSNANDLASNANSVVSAAQLVSDIMADGNVRAKYEVKAESAALANRSAAMVYNFESNAYKLANKNSADNQAAYNSNITSSGVLSLADSAALQNASTDINTTSSLASQYKISYASASSEVSSEASAEWKPNENNGLYNEVFGIINNPNGNGQGKGQGHNVVDEANALLNNTNVSNNVKANISAALNNYSKDTAKSAMANKVSELAKNPRNYRKAVNALPNTSTRITSSIINNVANALKVHLNPAEETFINSEVASHNINVNKHNNSLFVNGSRVPASVVRDEIKSKVNSINDAVRSDNNAISNLVKSNQPQSQGRTLTMVLGEAPTKQINFSTKDAATQQLLLDTAVQQNYGALKSSCDNAINSAKAASASDNAAVTSASAAMTSASAKNASANSAYQSANALANAEHLGDVVNIVKPSTNHNDFYAFSAKAGQPTVSDVLNNVNDTNSASVSSAVSSVASLANDAGSAYTSVSNASENYAKSTDANFVLANVYANSYEAMSSSDNSAFTSASAARANFYNTYAGSDFASDNDQLTSAKADEPNQGALANGYARYVQIHEPHVVTVTKQLVMHANPNYNDKTDTPADAKLAVINKGTHLLVENVGFDKHGNTRLYVNYNGKKGFITGLRNYVADSYLVPGEKYSVTFGRTANQYKGLQFNKANATKFSVKAGQTVTGTAVLNDDPHYWNGLTRLQLSNGNFVTTLDSYIKSATPLNGQSTQQSKGAYFWNGQDNTFKNVTK